MGRLRLLLCIALLPIIALLWVGIAAASVNIPLHHWSYEAIERLTALGIIDRAMIVTKPYSRAQAAKYVARAVERIRADEIRPDGREVLVEPLLERLMAEFRPELADLGIVTRKSAETSSVVRYGGRLQTEVDANSIGGGQAVRFRENRGGEYYAEGIQNQTNVRGWLEVGNWAALMVQPKFISNLDALSHGATVGSQASLNEQHAYLREASLKLTFWNVALEAGRGTQWWGPGYHGSLLLTDHAFPMDMIKLGSDEAFRLPWFLKMLGDFKINSFLAQFAGDRDFKHAKLFGVRLSYLPVSWLELGFTRLTQFGGQGQNQAFPGTVLKCYGRAQRLGGVEGCNEQAMADVRAKVPHIPYLVPFPAGVQIYGELASEDILTRPAYLVGLYIPQLLSRDTSDLRVELGDTDYPRRIRPDVPDTWYNNGLYTSGMRQFGFPLGHSMGTDAIDLYIRSTRYITEDLQLGTAVNYQERARGLPVHERKREAAVDLTWWYSQQTQVSVGYTYQHIKNPGQISSVTPFRETFAPGVTANNHLFMASVTVAF